jgi:tetratricopeptide (TPR) repeat protein
MIVDFREELPPLTNDEVYRVFVNTLDLLSGFSILFLQCSPSEANLLIPKICQKFPKKTIGVLELEEPIHNLYSVVKSRSDCEALNVLFVLGLEDSLKDDIKPGYRGLGDYYNLNTVPPILSHLNQQRENFRDHFPNICFVFVLPKFAIRYFVRRAPDFYDWNSGLFTITDKSTIEQFLSIRDVSNRTKSSATSKIPDKSLSPQEFTQVWYQKILEKISELWSDDFKVAQHFVSEGISLLGEEKYEEAINLFNKAVDVRPYLYEAWYYRGNALYNLGRYEEAIASYEHVAIKSYLYETWYYRGNALYILGRYKEAIASYEQSVAIKPYLYEAWYYRGDCLNNLDQQEKAIASYNRALAIKPDYLDAYFHRGDSLYILGRYEEAIASYDKVVAIEPDNHDAYLNLGDALYILGRYEEAIASYDKAVAINPDDYYAYLNRGNSLDDLGRYEEAIASYDKAVAIKPDDHAVWHSKGWIYFKWGKYSESISCSDQAIAIQSDNYISWHNKGLGQFVTCNYINTLDSWQRAFSYISDPHVPLYYEDISEIIQEFIKELIPRFTQLPIQQTLLIPLLEIYKQANVITELGAALVNTLHLIVAPTISDHTANQWLSLWRTSSLGNEPAMERPLRLMNTAIEYKKDPSKRQRLWLKLLSEERLILNKALKIQ